MVHYSATGVRLDDIQDEDFYISIWKTEDGMDSYFFTGDGIFYDLDNLCVNLYDLLTATIFDVNDYYARLPIEPQWFRGSGIDSELEVTKECYEQYLQAIMYGQNDDGKDNNIECGQTIANLAAPFQPISRYLYLYELHALVGYIQNNIISVQQSIADFYILLAEYKDLGWRLLDDDGEHCFLGAGGSCVRIFNALNAIIITINSIFDLIAKLSFETQNMPEHFENKVVKMKCNKIIFNYGRNDKCTGKLDIKNTIFEQSKNIKMVVELRNELIHNSSWQDVNKVYVRYKNAIRVEKFILIPDFTEDGQLIRSGNRNHFFSQENKINLMLPQIISEIMNRIYVTLEKIGLELGKAK